jgi:5-formyltetrahydrofolate cyclo-ligase
MPLVAFDKQHNRLGMGKGYYDRTFEFLKHHTSDSKPFLVGLGYQMQQVECLSTEAHDIPLDMIVTEKGILSA